MTQPVVNLGLYILLIEAKPSTLIHSDVNMTQPVLNLGLYIPLRLNLPH